MASAGRIKLLVGQLAATQKQLKVTVATFQAIRERYRKLIADLEGKVKVIEQERDDNAQIIESLETQLLYARTWLLLTLLLIHADTLWCEPAWDRM